MFMHNNYTPLVKYWLLCTHAYNSSVECVYKPLLLVKHMHLINGVTKYANMLTVEQYI